MRLIVYLLEFICKVQQVTMSFNEICMRDMVLLHYTQPPHEMAEVQQIWFRKDAVQHHRCHSIKVEQPLPGFIPPADFFSRIVRQMIERSWEVQSSVSNESTMGFPYFFFQHCPGPC
jgi:hypothetical protein